MTKTTTFRLVSTVTALGGLLFCDCSGPAETTSRNPAALPVASVAKVKNLLTGLHLSSSEAEAILANPATFRPIIDQWMETPEFHRKMLEFFKQAFQQTQITFTQFGDQLGSALPNLNSVIKTYLIRSAEMSFPITALALVDEGRPFTEVLTTERFMLNPPLMTLLAYLDDVVVDDNGQKSSFLAQKFGADFQFVLHYDDETTVAIEESLDPSSPNFLHFYEPCPRSNGIPKCGVLTVRDPSRVNQALLTHLLGPKFTDAHWNDWRMIAIRKPRPAKTRPRSSV
jgi:hypothetical protein